MPTTARRGVLLLMLFIVTPLTALAGGNANFTIGQRDLGGEWDPLDRQGMIGANVDWGMDDWPVHLAWGINGSAEMEEDYSSTNVDLVAAFAEISFGILWAPVRDRPFRPYIGAGIASVAAYYEAEGHGVSFDDDDQDFGYYANAGIYWRLGPRFNLGIDLRYGGGTEFDLKVPESFGGDRFEVDGAYFAYSLLLGFGWGN